MTAIVADIMDVMESLAPESLAEEWDNPGLQVGDAKWPVKSVWVALDASLDVVQSACRENVDVLITHHPLIFKPLNSVNIATPIGRIVQSAIEKRLALISAHTNLDSVSGGINDILARKIGLENISVLKNAGEEKNMSVVKNDFGLGRIGKIDPPLCLSEFAKLIKLRLDLKSLKVSGKSDLLVKHVVTCCGSGSSMMKYFFSSGAQVFVSGDLGYHDARDAEEMGLGLIDIGHFASEHLMLDVFVDRLRSKFTELNLDISVEACEMETDPFVLY